MSQKYAAYDNSGNITGFYDSDINPAIPAQSIAITDMQWMDCIDNPGQRMVDVSNKVIINTPAPSAAQQLSDAKNAQFGKVFLACKNQIYQGFSSSALGSAYHYPAQDRDQTNLNGCVTQSYWSGNPSGWTISFYCEDESGAWAKRPHTAAQIQQVGNDAINAIQAALNKNDSLQQQINAVGTEAAWAASTAYAANSAIQDSGYRYTCTTAGTSGAAKPVLPQTTNATVTDGTAVWTCQGTLTDYVGTITW